MSLANITSGGNPQIDLYCKNVNCENVSASGNITVDDLYADSVNVDGILQGGRLIMDKEDVSATYVSGDDNTVFTATKFAGVLDVQSVPNTSNGSALDSIRINIAGLTAGDRVMCCILNALGSAKDLFKVNVNTIDTGYFSIKLRNVGSSGSSGAIASLKVMYLVF